MYSAASLEAAKLGIPTCSVVYFLIRGLRPIKVSFIPVKGSHRFHIKNTNRHYADPLNPQIKLDQRLNGDDDDGGVVVGIYGRGDGGSDQSWLLLSDASFSPLPSSRRNLSDPRPP